MWGRRTVALLLKWIQEIRCQGETGLVEYTSLRPKRKTSAVICVAIQLDGKGRQSRPVLQAEFVLLHLNSRDSPKPINSSALFRIPNHCYQPNEEESVQVTGCWPTQLFSSKDTPTFFLKHGQPLIIFPLIHNVSLSTNKSLGSRSVFGIRLNWVQIFDEFKMRSWKNSTLLATQHTKRLVPTVYLFL